MQTRMSTNAIVNSEMYIRDRMGKQKTVEKTPMKGLLSRATNDTIESNDPLPIELKLKIREAFENA